MGLILTKSSLEKRGSHHSSILHQNLNALENHSAGLSRTAGLRDSQSYTSAPAATLAALFGSHLFFEAEKKRFKLKRAIIWMMEEDLGLPRASLLIIIWKDPGWFSPLTTPAHFCPAFHLTLYAFLILNAPSYFWLMFIVTAGYGYGHYLLIISDWCPLIVAKQIAASFSLAVAYSLPLVATSCSRH